MLNVGLPPFSHVWLCVSVCPHRHTRSHIRGREDVHIHMHTFVYVCMFVCMYMCSQIEIQIQAPHMAHSASSGPLAAAAAAAVVFVVFEHFWPQWEMHSARSGQIIFNFCIRDFSRVSSVHIGQLWDYV